nr:immunoglobulin light chain junction region [Macaca mulatta]
CQQGKTNVF